MKTNCFLLSAAVILLTGCAVDVFDENNPETKKAKAPIPMKAWLCAKPDPTDGFILIPGSDPSKQANSLPYKISISGHTTHMGEVITEKSWFKTVSMRTIDEEGIPYLIQTGYGLMTAANNDGYNIYGTIKTSLITWRYTGCMDMFGGTGTFEGISGKVNMTGCVDRNAGTNCWIGEGTVQYN